MTTVSACLIVKDEAQNLPRCLASLQGVVDEIIVVDTGSTDDSCRIAESFGARVHLFAWRNDFSAARNAALEQASGDWILSLDADEELEENSRGQLLRELVSSARADGFYLTVRNLQPPGELTPWLDMQILRLFRHLPGVVFEGAIHEQVTPSLLRAGGNIQTGSLILLHYGYQLKEAQGKSRAHRNLELLQEALKITPDDPYLQYQLGATLKSLNLNEEARTVLEKALMRASDLSADVLAGTYMRLAQIYLMDDAFDSVMKNALACLHIEPDNIPALYAAALASYSLGKKKEAYTFFERLAARPEISEQDLSNIRQVMASIQTDFHVDS
ncbi:MAG: glycosyltransferase [Leptolinea sp.]|jgi:glycosyltransferase involved in cell wall biosynthesis|nr:glycosyltransferase [Leptolinea sp.]